MERRKALKRLLCCSVRRCRQQAAADRIGRAFGSFRGSGSAMDPSAAASPELAAHREDVPVAVELVDAGPAAQDPARLMLLDGPVQRR